jgi:hypothetical protein
MVDRLADGMNVKKDDLTPFHPIGRLPLQGMMRHK